MSSNMQNTNRTKRKTNTSNNTRRKTSPSSGSNRSNTTASRKNTAKKTQKKQELSSVTYIDEIVLILSFALVIFLFLCTIGLIGTRAGASHYNFGDYVQFFMLGIFGFTAYIVPVVAFFLMALAIANKNNFIIWIKISASIVLLSVIGIFLHLICFPDLSQYEGNLSWIKEFYDARKGGGVIFGSMTLGLDALIGKIGTIFLLLVVMIISFIVLTGKSFFSFIKKAFQGILLFVQKQRDRAESEDDDEFVDEQEENVRRPVATGRHRGVTTDTLLTPQNTQAQEVYEEQSDSVHLQQEVEHVISLEHEEITEPVSPPERNDIHRIVYHEDQEGIASTSSMQFYDNSDDDEAFLQPVNVEQAPTFASIAVADTPNLELPDSLHQEEAFEDEEIISFSQPVDPKPVAHLRSRDNASLGSSLQGKVKDEMHPKKNVPYKFPPVSLLRAASKTGSGNSSSDLEKTARHLEETLETFGVHVKVTDFSCGPSVTRFELQPEQGVKVSKILSLSDDIKLNLAAADIRIEAPIPGKMAVGIEVPNKTSTSVSFRELVDHADFRNFQSNLAFAVGKDIGGKAVYTDIAKMPHVLIAGATGSGKSVCINTLIMSILYKAHPDDVKIIMIDPKVVELSVYNGIPHLLIPVVTDTRKASAALAWGVAEMTERYKRFADMGVRDLKGYNQKVEQGLADGSIESQNKMPQIVIIVDELADLMMVAAKEVEESICRLAQLARAAGIHLIIATQRPSVDVITGLIKANMPSRIAFSVTSGVDSRTILDTNGAEKLLGKGDMLFFPQGFTKPARVQGAFVSDDEVINVVDFIKNQAVSNDYGDRIEETIAAGISSEQTSFSGADEQDTYFTEAARFVVEKEKGSIGMLQRVFKIGFNRAARIMDQLEAAGIVGPEEGTKPRRILMSKEQLDNYLSNR